jgi:hypothetical protein
MAGTTTYYGISYPTSTDYVKDGAAAIQTVATGFDSAVAIPTYNAQTGTTYTFALTDVGKTVTASNASAQTYTIPPTASVAWAANTTLYVINLGAGVVTFAAGAGVTVTNTAQTLAQYQSGRLVRTGLNAWTVTPDSGTASGLNLISSTTIGSAVASVTVTGVFSAAYDNYKITITGGTATANTAIQTQMRAGATTEAGALYAGASAGATYAAGTFNSDWNGTTSTFFQYTGFARSTGGLSFNMELANPFGTEQTLFTSAYMTNLANRTAGGFLNTTTSYDGFVLTPQSGTMTGGIIRVYGYTK